MYMYVHGVLVNLGRENKGINFSILFIGTP